MATYNAANPNASMGEDGGHLFNNMYFFWPFLPRGGTWDEDNLPTSNFAINYGTTIRKLMSRENITDAFGQFEGKIKVDLLIKEV